MPRCRRPRRRLRQARAATANATSVIASGHRTPAWTPTLADLPDAVGATLAGYLDARTLTAVAIAFDVRLPASPPSLADLPDAAASTLAGYLDTRALGAVVWSCPNAPRALVNAFRATMTLRIPPDTERNARMLALLQALAARRDADAWWCVAEPTIAPTQFAVADTEHSADVLLPVRRRVHALAVSSNQYTAWPGRPFRWDIVAQLTALVRLEIDHVWDQPLDLEELSISAPRLQELVLKRARRIVNKLRGLGSLRVLHLEDTNINSFSVAVGLPRLESLALLTTPYGHAYLRNVSALASVAPLTRLVVRGMWSMCPRAALRAHADTLREYDELDKTMYYHHSNRGDYNPQWARFTHLRSLRIGRFWQTDVSPLATLVSLEHLQVVMSDSARHCRPLRHLTRLRELQLSNGWLCDLVGYLPRLEKLVWEDRSSPYTAARQTLWQRTWPDVRDGNDEQSVRRNNYGGGVGMPMGLRQLVMRGDVYVGDHRSAALAMLERVEQLEVYNRADVFFADTLKWIAGLRHLKRLLFRDIDVHYVRGVFERQFPFACAESLEELHFKPFHNSTRERCRVAPFPRWFFDQLPNLRVLASPLHELFVELASMCPRLTHLHLPFSTECAFPLASRESLSRLCVVSLALDYDCAWLRAERGQGGAMPSLRCIFHPTTDCLCWCVCRRHEIVVGRNWKYQSFIAESVLVPSWGHKWELMRPYDEIDHSHRLVDEVDE